MKAVTPAGAVCPTRARRATDFVIELAASVRSRATSILSEQPDHDQENHRPDDGVDDRRDDPADENKSDQWHEPTGQDGADNADHDVTNESKPVSLDD